MTAPMLTRSPLPGWEGGKLATAVLWISPVSELGVERLSSGIFSWWASLDGGDSYFAGQADTLEQAQIAAEDSARAWLGWVADAIGWLAPIPSPAVCEALAQYAEALTQLEDGSVGEAVTPEWLAIAARRKGAALLLDAAILAERDGEA